MAKKRRPSTVKNAAPAKQPAPPDINAMKAFARTEGLRYLAAHNINSVGIGHKISTRGPSGALCIQFTVEPRV